MYSRSYKDASVPLPEGYSGTAFTEPWESGESQDEPEIGSAIDENREAASASAHAPSDRSSFGGVLGGLFSGAGLHMPKIGTEEILILAAAAFLFFSEGGDKECANLLLLLLFV